MEAHFEALWDLFKSIPSLAFENASVLDEMYWLHKDNPSSNPARAIHNRGEKIDQMKDLTLTRGAAEELMKLVLTREEDLHDERIDEFFGEEFFASNFWLYWATMFAFEPWASALEMRRYTLRFIHHISTLADLTSLRFTRYNQYESLVLPMTKWLSEQGVRFQYDTEVTDVEFDLTASAKRATRIEWTRSGERAGDTGVDLGDDDYVLMTIGSLVDNSDEGDHHTAATLNRGPASAWDLWKKIARKDPSFGRPEVFCSSIDETKWESATVTTLDERIPEYIRRIAKRDPFSGRVVTGGIVTVKDSSWLMSWTVNRQPHFKKQPKDQIVVWVYSLFVDTPGDYVKKPMSECTGEEITAEWLYHLGVPEADIPELAATGAKCVPVMMPYVTSFFMPRKAGDRPDVVPEGAENFAFIGQFAETSRDCIFTTEYSVRTGMEATYQLFGVERGVPEVFNSTYDVRTLLDASARLKDGEKTELPGPAVLRRKIAKGLDSTEIGVLLREHGIL